MRDDFLSADWADNHATMSNGIGRLFELVAESFERLTAIQFEAPWQQHNCDNKQG